jgi:hypothetical protein
MNRAAWDSLVATARAVDLLELAASVGATLHREGAEHVGPCPVCGGDDRFSINPGKNVFHCRGCTRGGAGAIDLQIFLDGGDFVGAVKTLTGTESLAGKRAAPADVKAKAEQRRREAAEYEAAQHRKASLLWSSGLSIDGTIAERYLREARGITGPLPATLRFLPARGEYPPALIAAFALPHELEPGELAASPQHVEAVHLIKLTADGSDRLRQDKGKITVGRPLARPIVLAPVNDLLGLAICEGLEDALTAHCAAGLGAWASVSAPHMPALAATVPAYVETVTIFAHNDGGLQHAKQLAALLRARGIEVTVEVS